MGWIRERMEDLEPAISSFMVLAQRVREARSWPKTEALKASSLATYLGKFDEGEALDWLEQRPAVILALADALQMTREDLAEQLTQLLAPQGGASVRLRLRDVPTRPIDLRREPLPPGIPQKTQDPASWPVWWYAPSGSGRTLVGQWLEARGLAVFIQAQTWAEAEQLLPEERAAFIELGSTEGVPLWNTWPAQRKVCIATEAHPPRPPESQTQGNESEDGVPHRAPPPLQIRRFVESPEASVWLQPLLGWVDERITVEEFDADACRRWFLGPQGILSMVDNLGTALGLIGLFATYGRKGGTTGPLAKARNLSDMARLFLRMQVGQTEGIDLSVEALWERLRLLSRSLIHESTESWFEARPLDAWHALVRTRPDEADLDWLKELETRGLKVDRASLDKVRGGLPPGAFRTVKALRELGLLRERQPRQFVFRPPWVLVGLREHAILDTLDEGPTAWGVILLHQEGAALVLDQLLERCRRNDFAPVRNVLAEPDTHSPAWVAALEAAFRVLGLAVLEGVQVPEELCLGVLRHQRTLIVPNSEGAPQPRIAYAHEYEEEEPLLDRGVWYAALLVLAEGLPPHAELSLEAWCQGLSPYNLKWLLDRAACRISRKKHVREPWLMPLLLLGGRLMDRLKLSTFTETWPADLLQPEHLLRLLERENLAQRDLEYAVHWDDLGAALPEYARRRGVDWERLARKVWTVWLAKGDIQLPQFLLPNTSYAPIFWNTLPPEAVEVFLDQRRAWVLTQEETFRFFRQEHWDAFLQCWIDRVPPEKSWWSDAPLAALQSLPPEHLRRAIRAGRPDGYDHSSRNLLWQRLPEVFCEEIDALFRQGQWDKGLTQAWAAPSTYVPRMLASAEAGLAQGGTPPPPSVARWLHDRIAARAPGWEKAWMLLERLVPTGPAPAPLRRGAT